MKPKSLLLLGVSGTFGLIAAALLTKAIGQNNSASSDVQVRTVMVATDDLAIHAKLDVENTKMEKWPANILPPGVVTDAEEISNKRLNVRVAKGAPIFLRDLVDEHAPQSLPIPRGKKVVGLKVPSEDHIAGLLQPGHEVDVIGIFRSRDQPSFSRTFLRGIKVFSVNNRTNPDMQDEAKADQSDITVSLIVSEKEAEKLTLVQGAGNSKIKLAIRGLDDDSDLVDGDDDSQETVSLNDVANPGQAAAKDALGLGNLLGDFLKGSSLAMGTSDPNAAEKARKEKGQEPFKVKVINGDVVTEYVVRDDAAPQVQGGGIPAPNPVDPFRSSPAEQEGGLTLESLRNGVDPSADSENLEF